MNEDEIKGLEFMWELGGGLGKVDSVRLVGWMMVGE